MNKRYTFPALFAFIFLLFTTGSYASLITSNQQSNSVVWTIVQAGFPVEKVILTVTGPDPTTSSCVDSSDCSYEFPSGVSPVFDISGVVAGSYNWLVQIIIDTSSCDQATSRELQGGLQGLIGAPVQTYLSCLASLNFPDSADLTASGTFLVTAAGDLIAPPGTDLIQPFFLTAPGDLSVEANAVLTAVVIGDASTTTEHPPVTISNDAPAAGYPLGGTTVTWTGVDDIGEIAVDTQLITIVDTTPPVITIPGDMTEEATAVLTPVDIGLATATDIFPVTIVNDAPASYPLGTTVVTWTATDASGNSASGAQSITIVDTTPPVLTVPADITEEATGPLTPVDIGLATATDIFAVTIVNDAPASYPLGTTVVTWTATDANGNSASDAQSINIVDTTAPVFDFTQHETELSPPNHKMVLVATVSNVSDLVDPNPLVSIVVTSNQPINGTGDGNTDADWEVVQNGDSWLVYVRAERSGNLGARIYDIAVTVTDFSDNASTDAGVVTVPHDKGKKK